MNQLHHLTHFQCMNFVSCIFFSLEAIQSTEQITRPWLWVWVRYSVSLLPLYLLLTRQQCFLQRRIRVGVGWGWRWRWPVHIDVQQERWTGYGSPGVMRYGRVGKHAVLCIVLNRRTVHFAQRADCIVRTGEHHIAIVSSRRRCPDVDVCIVGSVLAEDRKHVVYGEHGKYLRGYVSEQNGTLKRVCRRGCQVESGIRRIPAVRILRQ